MCVDMSEMFVSSLWKGDFGKLSRVIFGFKRGSQVTCAVLPFCTKVKYRGDRWSYMAATPREDEWWCMKDQKCSLERSGGLYFPFFCTANLDFIISYYVFSKMKMLWVIQKRSRKGEKRIVNSREVSFFFLCPSTSSPFSMFLSLCCYRNSSVVLLLLSLWTMCSVEGFGRSLNTLGSTAMGA